VCGFFASPEVALNAARPTKPSAQIRSDQPLEARDRQPNAGAGGHATFTGRWLPWLLLLPTLVILAVFSYVPAVRTLRLSVFRANIIVGNEQFVGADNFVALLSSRVYHQVMLQTLVFLALVVLLGLMIALGLAWLASQPIAGAKFYRLMLIYPYALSPAIAGTLWLFLFNPEVGAVNNLLGTVFGVKPRWLDQPFLAFALVVAATIWKGLGFNIVFYLAAIQNIPNEVMEAAQIDGATPWQRFRRIVLPLLSPMTFFLSSPTSSPPCLTASGWSTSSPEAAPCTVRRVSRRFWSISYTKTVFAAFKRDWRLRRLC
jgi:sn-glycerol 3-phosphate transport system permease protein